MEIRIMSKKIARYLLIAVFILIIWIVFTHPDWIVGGLPKAGAQSIGTDKYDSDCAVIETVGGCFEKPASEPTGCLAGDAIPLGPECDKFTPRDPVYNTQEVVMPPTTSGFAGK